MPIYTLYTGEKKAFFHRVVDDLYVSHYPDLQDKRERINIRIMRGRDRDLHGDCYGAIEFGRFVHWINCVLPSNFFWLDPGLREDSLYYIVGHELCHIALGFSATDREVDREQIRRGLGSRMLNKDQRFKPSGPQYLSFSELEELVNDPVIL